MEIKLYTSSDKQAWDSYVLKHTDSTHCHLSGWKGVIENTYGHKSYYLIAQNESRIMGILPLVHIKSIIFGSQLVSTPFLNYGGVLADGEEAGKLLLSEAIKLDQKLKVKKIELRHTNPLAWLKELYPDNSMNPINSVNPSDPINFSLRTHKVRMLLELPASSDELFKSYNSKLRSQIRRSQKAGMAAVIGGVELLYDFYRVFSINMRDLGSPVHSKKFFSLIFDYFGECVKIGVVYYQGKPVAAGFIFCFRNIVEIPWASSLRKYNAFSPNMLLYWSLLEYSANHGFHYFDFGRSTPGEGTFKFKQQWGAKPFTLYWYSRDHLGNENGYIEKTSSTVSHGVAVWQQLPVFVANLLGPILRGSISL
jgi:serine/alanine adding enzyme